MNVRNSSSSFLFTDAIIEARKPLETVTRVEITVNNNSNECVDCVAFCPFDWASNLIAFESGAIGKLTLGLIKANDSNIEFQHIQDFIVGTKISCITWSPETALASIPKLLKLAFSTVHTKRIHILKVVVKVQNTNDSSTQKDDNCITLLDCKYGNHSSFVNDLVFEPQTGSLLASVGDDCFCCLWSATDGALESRIRLMSAGSIVRWHPSEANKLLVAEKRGLIRLYNIENKKPVISFECNAFPLLAADWCLNNNLIIGAAVGSEIYIWNTSVSSMPIEKRMGHVQGCTKFTFFNDSVYCSRGRPGSRLQVCNTKTGQRISSPETVLRGIVNYRC
ncbi:nucleoporin Nup37-like protein [Leptotrombidium deliense]|uniref:Nucleoporin Nup37-like protein n=1 Tax=Leptotrombidium deliense TaxID=299467 RepID=A0A443SRT4_9ACAR|nr:nucleoporin Nup37-like protein [Leptotrombidium deliense]